MYGSFLLQDGRDDAAVRVDMPHVRMQLPLAAPPRHPSSHPIDEDADTFRCYSPFEVDPPASGKVSPTCSASTLAMYVASGSSRCSDEEVAFGGNVSRRLPVLLIPSATVRITDANGCELPSTLPLDGFPQVTRRLFCQPQSRSCALIHSISGASLEDCEFKPVEEMPLKAAGGC